MAAALPIAVVAASSLFSGIQQRNQFKAQADAAQRQADIERATGELKADSIRGQAEKLIGRQLALAGASGADPSSGSFIDIFADTGSASARDVWATKQTAAWQAENLEASARNYKSQANSAIFGSLLQGAGKLAMSGAFGGGGTATTTTKGIDPYKSGSPWGTGPW